MNRNPFSYSNAFHREPKRRIDWFRVLLALAATFVAYAWFRVIAGSGEIARDIRYEQDRYSRGER